MRGFAVLVVLLAGCDVVLGLKSRPADAAQVPDSPLGAWLAPQPLTSLNTGLEGDPSMTADGLEVMFSSARLDGVNFDLYLAKRATTDTDFDTPVRVAEISSPEADFGYLSADGLSVYLTRGVDGDILRASRTDRASAFGALIVDAGLSTAALDRNPALSGDGLTAVIDHDEPGFGRELFMFSRDRADAPWGPPIRIEGVSTTGHESAPSLDAQGLILVFHTDREGTGNELYVTTRASRTDAFSFSRTSPIEEINSTGMGIDPHLSPDARTLLFARGPLLYIATR